MSEKTIEQIRDELANKTYPMQVVNGADWNTSLRVGFNAGFDAAIKLCEQRERDLVDLLERAKSSVRTHAMQTHSKVSAELADELDQFFKHRGENEN